MWSSTTPNSHKTSRCTAQLNKTLWPLSKDSISLKSQWPCLPKQALPHYTPRRPLTRDYRRDAPSQSHSSSVARGVSEPSDGTQAASLSNELSIVFSLQRFLKHVWVNADPQCTSETRMEISSETQRFAVWGQTMFALTCSEAWGARLSLLCDVRITG